LEGAAAAAPKQGMIRRALGWYWGQRDSAEKGEPVKRTLVAVILLVLGVAGSEAYGSLRDKFRDPDAYLVRMKQDQDAAFKQLQDSLGALGRSVDGDGREALAEVKSAVGEMKAANAGLLAQLELAKQENQRLSQVAGRQAGVTGGYDLILSPKTGMALDVSSVLGVDRISNGGAWVNLSSKDAEGQHKYLESGEAIAYRNARGQSCKVSLLSVSGNESASFKTSCG
jgi:hypothetical protein